MVYSIELQVLYVTIVMTLVQRITDLSLPTLVLILCTRYVM